jgi:type 1 glutamine amidotransferase
MKKVLFYFLCCNLFGAAFGQDQFRVLLYTRQDEWHQDSIPPAVNAFKEMAREHQFALDWTTQSEDIGATLMDFDVVVFLNADADVLTEGQLASLKRFMDQGGGFVGIHAAASGKIRNEWFDKLIGGVFVNHPKIQSGIMNVLKTDFPATLHLGDRWLWSDEWYNFKDVQYGNIEIILTVDESSYDYSLGYDDVPLEGMGNVHPVAWYQTFGGGRSFYTSLGHKPEVFKKQKFLDHIFGGIYWASQ